jgi:hypothetical protein
MKTKQEVLKEFKAYILPELKKTERNGKDIVMRELEWSYYIDGLCKDGQITDSKYNKWSTPKL